MDISVFGLGYVGIVSAVSLARLGHTIVGVDIDRLKLDRITRGVSPVVEPGVDDLLRRALAAQRLSVTSDAATAVQATAISLICVGTPSKPDGSPNLDQVMRVVSEVGRALRSKPSYHGVVIRSTALPGTVDLTTNVIAEISGKSCGLDFGVAANPEFMRTGTSIEDFEHPPFTVVGTSDQRLAQMLADMYAGIEAPFRCVGAREAEMLKYACNAFHGVKVTFANEIGAICKRLGIDSHSVMALFVEDTKLNASQSYLRPGFAFGGSCLPKDLRAITGEAGRLDVPIPLLSSVLPSNDQQIERVIRWVVETRRKLIGVLGLSFKSGTDELRESPMVQVVETLLENGCDVAVYDPNVSVPRLIGANKSYLAREIPDISRLMRGSMREVLDEAEVILIAKEVPGVREALDSLRPDQIVYDLVGISGYCGLPHGSYQGIYW